MPAADPRAVESLLAFWAEAGVDVTYGETPNDRMAAGLEALKPRLAAAPIAARKTSAAPSGSPPRAPGVDPAAVASARDAAVAAGDLEALQAAIAAYEGCDLKRQGARQAVFARGDPDAAVMVIGEGPGAEEDLQGAPFVGRAGKLLDKMLAAAGLEGRVFITNTVFWRPPGNRTPTPAEQAACAPFLERAIELVQPKMLMLAGGASAKHMLSTPDGILSLRGRWFEWRSADGTLELPALPTLHPAFLLRQSAAKKKAWEDLMMLVERLDRPARPT
ncbi:MAG TPA: uracil-DNA glycosylase [Caulobacteraceae bacterium]|jgi:DNA polymerase|nr:uracil-DNA glycosylase [Caulobacteraceae bacterium]